MRLAELGAEPTQPRLQPAGEATRVSTAASAFLTFCRVEKGLSANSLDAYRRDLASLAAWCKEQKIQDYPSTD